MHRISRREMLAQVGFAGGALAAGMPVVAAEVPNAASTNPSKLQPKVVIAGGHPGDPEYGCGGTIARYADAGSEIILLYLNRGDPSAKSPDDPASPRTAEAQKACGILRARPAFAGQIDGHPIIDPAHSDHFTVLLRAEKPDVVFTHWPIDNHGDHRAISSLVYDAWIKMGKKFALYYYEVSNGEDTVQFNPTHYVNITETEQRKRQACYAHASQAPEKFYGLQEMVMRLRGLDAGCRHAEAFIHHPQSPAAWLP